MKIKRAICLLMTVLFVMAMTPAMAAACTHSAPAADSDCIVCKVAAMINALPAKDDITIDNAAAVTDRIHAIDRVKVEIETDEEYEALLKLVNTTDNGSIAGYDVPQRYVDAVDKVSKLTGGGSLYITKKFVAADGTAVNALDAQVQFKLTNVDTKASQLLTMTTLDFQQNSLGAASGFYSASTNNDGWTYKYLLPAGTYTIEETYDCGAKVDGKPFVTGSTTYEVNGTKISEGETIEVEDNESLTVLATNMKGYTLTFHANNGKNDEELQYFSPGEPQDLRNNTFTRDGYTFVGWTEHPDGSGKSYTDEHKSVILDNDLHLYAQWEKIVSNGSVTFDLGDIDGVTGCVLDFGTREAGYSSVPAQKITIDNNSHYKAQVSCSTLDGYTVSSNFTLEKNQSGTFNVNPKDGLGVNTYNNDLYITVKYYESTGDLSTASPNPLKVSVKFKVVPPTSTPTPTPGGTTSPSGYSGPSLWYIGGNTFGTSTTKAPTKVEIDGAAVPFTMNGSKIIVSCINADADWVTARWGSTTNTVNFTPDAAAYCTQVSIPKTGDMPLWAAIAAFLGF